MAVNRRGVFGAGIVLALAVVGAWFALQSQSTGFAGRTAPAVMQRQPAVGSYPAGKEFREIRTRDRVPGLAGVSLTGILWADRPAMMGAIISTPQGENTYRVGDQVAERAVLTDILVDRVILTVGDTYTTLRLSDMNGARYQDDNDVGERMILALRDALYEGPEKVLALLDAKPVSREGRQIGYRVFPPEVPAFIDLLGLEPGDIVTHVNGVPLNSADSLRQVLASLPGTDRFQLTVRRNGIAERISMGMPGL